MELKNIFEANTYWQDSYTTYQNIIGLSANGKFIDEVADSKVVLDFPYKDAVLEAGMTKEDQTNSNEIFYNTIIARAEIDELEEPKVLVNNKKLTTEERETTFNEAISLALNSIIE